MLDTLLHALLLSDHTNIIPNLEFGPYCWSFSFLLQWDHPINTWSNSVVMKVQCLGMVLRAQYRWGHTRQCSWAHSEIEYRASNMLGMCSTPLNRVPGLLPVFPGMFSFRAYMVFLPLGSSDHPSPDSSWCPFLLIFRFLKTIKHSLSSIFFHYLLH